jgi:hypothetical protein
MEIVASALSEGEVDSLRVPVADNDKAEDADADVQALRLATGELESETVLDIVADSLEDGETDTDEVKVAEPEADGESVGVGGAEADNDTLGDAHAEGCEVGEIVDDTEDDPVTVLLTEEQDESVAETDTEILPEPHALVDEETEMDLVGELVAEREGDDDTLIETDGDAVTV